jgi:hypothetical protein
LDFVVLQILPAAVAKEDMAPNNTKAAKVANLVIVEDFFLFTNDANSWQYSSTFSPLLTTAARRSACFTIG